ncbi:TerD family protein [Nocardia sp. CWNU-33]|uniref:TerD family protein n=1 Tax=Nocardia sp. CWNU-33 TaxID=3392117 RepID=UPI00398E403D
MSVTLAKGGNVSLSKQAPNLTKVTVGLGWDVRTTTGADYDLDASALATGPSLKVLSDQHFIFYNNLRSPEGTIEHTGDNLTGEGEGDDETIVVDLVATPPTITNIFFPVSIHDADARGQSFGQIRNAFIRVVDQNTGAELARYDLTEDASTETAMVFGELYRYGNEWKFRAIGQGYASGLAGIARDYGVHI